VTHRRRSEFVAVAEQSLTDQPGCQLSPESVYESVEHDHDAPIDHRRRHRDVQGTSFTAREGGDQSEDVWRGDVGPQSSLPLGALGELADVVQKATPGAGDALAAMVVEGFGQADVVAKPVCQGGKEDAEAGPGVTGCQRVGREAVEFLQDVEENGLQEPLSVGKTSVHGPDPDLGEARDVVIAGLEADLADCLPGGSEHAVQVGLRVGAQGTPAEPGWSVDAPMAVVARAGHGSGL
jgi:hypothetical protein